MSTHFVSDNKDLGLCVCNVAGSCLPLTSLRSGFGLLLSVLLCAAAGSALRVVFRLLSGAVVRVVFCVGSDRRASLPRASFWVGAVAVFCLVFLLWLLLLLALGRGLFLIFLRSSCGAAAGAAATVLIAPPS
jgi:hypothetical protein